MIAIGDPKGILGRAIGIENQSLWEGMGLLAVAVAAHALRRQSRARATNIISEDWRRYDELWAAIVRRDTARGTITALSRRTAQLTATLPPSVLQRGRNRPEGPVQHDFRIGWALSCPAFSPSTALATITTETNRKGDEIHGDPEGEIIDIDQLFAQVCICDAYERG